MGRHMGNDEREQTLNQLLTELDGFDSNALVICLAATNRPDTLDTALRRPGRFDRIVTVSRPDRQGREEILRVHLKTRGLPLAPSVDVPDLSSATAGFTARPRSPKRPHFPPGSCLRQRPTISPVSSPRL